MVGPFDKTPEKKEGEVKKPFIRESTEKRRDEKKEEKTETQPKSASKFFSPDQMDETKKGIDTLFYGDSNSGKTFIAHTFPEPIFIIDTEGRANKTRQYHFGDKDIRIFNPMEVNTDFKDDNSLEDAVDFEASVDNITNVLIEFFNKVKSGEIKEGTLVLDSFSDLWTWVQEWGKIRLAKKDKVDLTLFRLKNQFDWGMMNSRHYKLIVVMRKLLDYGINLVGTARESKSPDYDYKDKPAAVTLTLSDKIRSQKDVPFWFSTIINLQIKRVKVGNSVQKKFVAAIDKLETFNHDGEPIENLTYKKIKELIDQKRKESGK